MKDSSRQSQERSFDRVLADVRRSEGFDEKNTVRLRNPAAGAVFPFAETDLAAAELPDNPLDWFVETEEPSPEKLELPLSDDPDAIAAELGLDRPLNEQELNQARRRFMWRNHPDRLKHGLRNRADRRVAVANMLIDRARAELAAAKRKRF
jgi:hypothetical protein